MSKTKEKLSFENICVFLNMLNKLYSVRISAIMQMRVFKGTLSQPLLGHVIRFAIRAKKIYETIFLIHAKKMYRTIFFV